MGRPSRRSAVLTYRNSTQATKAIEVMNGKVFMKEILSVTISQPNKRKKASKKEIKNNDKIDNNTVTSTSFTIINSDQSRWEELEHDTKDFDLDIKDFKIEDQDNPSAQGNEQITHHPYIWNDSIDQQIKQEITEEEQQEEDQLSWLTSDSLPSLESNQDNNFNSSSTSEVTTTHTTTIAPTTTTTTT